MLTYESNFFFVGTSDKYRHTWRNSFDTSDLHHLVVVSNNDLLYILSFTDAFGNCM